MSVLANGQVRIAILAWLATVGAAVSLFPLFDRKGYLVAGAVAALVVTAVGIGLRALRAPAVIVVLAQVVAVVEWVVVTRAFDQAWYGVVPTPDAISWIARLLSSGVETAAAYSAPVPTGLGLVLLVALGIAGTAIAVDFVAVGLRAVPWAGLPLLALYTVPVATVPAGVPAVAFVPGALGYVALLAAEERERVSNWGKQITRTGALWNTTRREQVSTTALAQTGRRIGLTAVALAVVLPMFLPAFPEHLFSGGSGLGGSGPVAISNPMVDLKRDLVRGPDTDVVYVRTTDADPRYLKLTALDEFTGISWQPSVRDIPPDQQAGDELPAPAGLAGSVPRSPAQYELSVTKDFESTWLPRYYPTVAVSVNGDWRYDTRNLDIVSAEEDVTTAGLAYEVESLTLTPPVHQLQAASPPPTALGQFFTRLPADLPDEVGEQAQLVTQSARTDFERAVALQEWFRSAGDFTYSTTRDPGNSADVLVNFLTVDRVGYCEQFAAAMALMARTLDIPSRVAVGFLRPERLAPDRYVFSTHDLHTWPELYFQGVGWVRFEPTPASRTDDAPPYTEGVLSGGGFPAPGNEPAPGTGRDPDLDPSTGLNALDRLPERGEEAVASAPTGSGWPSPALVILVLALLAVPAAARAGVRWWRWRTARTSVATAETAWSELRDSASDLGIGWAGSLTPRGTASALRPHLHEDSGAEQALDRLVGFVERARYARVVEAHPRARRDVATVVSALRAGARPRRRVQAVVAPASLVPDLSAAWRRAVPALRG